MIIKKPITTPPFVGSIPSDYDLLLDSLVRDEPLLGRVLDLVDDDGLRSYLVTLAKALKDSKRNEEGWKMLLGRQKVINAGLRRQVKEFKPKKKKKKRRTRLEVAIARLRNPNREDSDGRTD